MPKIGDIQLRLTREAHTGEYLVQVYEYKGGAFRLYEPATYFTDDKEDAFATRDAMQERYESLGHTVTWR